MSHDVSSDRLGRRAVVIGGSLTGLVAARVLSTRFDEVMVFDRDRLSDAPEPRAGVPQGRHGHGLLASGFSALQTLFPTLEADLMAAGAIAGDLIGDLRWHQHGYTKARFDSGLRSVLASRPLLEGLVRDHVRRLPNVTIFDNCTTLGLKMDAARTRVTGVVIRSSRSHERICASDLVIDASGRASRSPEWLTEFGFDAPEMDTVQVGIGYTTRTFRRRPGELDGTLAAVIAPVRRGKPAWGSSCRWSTIVGSCRSAACWATMPRPIRPAFSNLPARCRGPTSMTSSSPPNRSATRCPSGFRRMSAATTNA